MNWSVLVKTSMFNLSLFFSHCLRFNSELNMANNRFNVFDMPVYGSNVTISGLTLRQGTAGSNVGRCSAFIPAISGDGVIAAKASFTGEVGGNIIFVSCVWQVF